jgi:hypothetical protein
MTARSKDARPRAKRSELKTRRQTRGRGGLFCIAKGAVLEVKRRR